MINDSILNIIKKAKVAEIEANNILKDYGDSYKSRILDLESLRKQLKNIPIDIYGYLMNHLNVLNQDIKSIHDYGMVRIFLYLLEFII